MALLWGPCLAATHKLQCGYCFQVLAVQPSLCAEDQDHGLPVAHVLAHEPTGARECSGSCCPVVTQRCQLTSHDASGWRLPCHASVHKQVLAAMHAPAHRG